LIDFLDKKAKSENMEYAERCLRIQGGLEKTPCKWGEKKKKCEENGYSGPFHTKKRQPQEQGDRILKKRKRTGDGGASRGKPKIKEGE